MRLIDADALRANLYREVFGIPSLQRLDNSCYIPYRMFEDALRKTSNVDAVEVIRCKDCKYCYVSEEHTLDTPVCKVSYLYRHTTFDDYCSLAKRREEDET